jgi:hypothetical protein
VLRDDVTAVILAGPLDASLRRQRKICGSPLPEDLAFGRREDEVSPSLGSLPFQPPVRRHSIWRPIVARPSSTSAEDEYYLQPLSEEPLDPEPVEPASVGYRVSDTEQLASSFMDRVEASVRVLLPVPSDSGSRPRIQPLLTGRFACAAAHRVPSRLIRGQLTTLAESVIGLFKTEVIRRRGPWRSLKTSSLQLPNGCLV